MTKKISKMLRPESLPWKEYGKRWLPSLGNILADRLVYLETDHVATTLLSTRFVTVSEWYPRQLEWWYQVDSP